MLLAFAGALRRCELAAVRVEHIEPRAHGLQLTLPRSKGARAGRSVTIAIPADSTAACPIKALYRWLEAAGIGDGAVFRRTLGRVPVQPGSGPAFEARARAPSRVRL